MMIWAMVWKPNTAHKSLPFRNLKPFWSSEQSCNRLKNVTYFHCFRLQCLHKPNEFFIFWSTKFLLNLGKRDFNGNNCKRLESCITIKKKIEKGTPRSSGYLKRQQCIDKPHTSSWQSIHKDQRSKSPRSHSQRVNPPQDLVVAKLIHQGHFFLYRHL